MWKETTVGNKCWGKAPERSDDASCGSSRQMVWRGSSGWAWSSGDEVMCEAQTRLRSPTRGNRHLNNRKSSRQRVSLPGGKFLEWEKVVVMMSDAARWSVSLVVES